MTDYEKTVKHRLIDLEKTQAWLAAEASKKTGLFCDGRYLSAILSGKQAGTKIKAAINEILNIEQ